HPPPAIISRRPSLDSPHALDRESRPMRGRGKLPHFGREFVAFSLARSQNVGTEQQPPSPPGLPPYRGDPMRFLPAFLVLVLCASSTRAAKPPVYIWLEPDWFEGVQGTLAYWAASGNPA